MLGAELAEQARQVDEGDRDQRADAQRSRSPPRTSSTASRAAWAARSWPGPRAAAPRRVGQRDPLGAALEQLGAELALQRPDRGGHPRLDDPESLGGPREVAFLGDGHEVHEMSQLHRISQI